jgi:hypothetical protein
MARKKGDLRLHAVVETLRALFASWPGSDTVSENVRESFARLESAIGAGDIAEVVCAAYSLGASAITRKSWTGELGEAFRAKVKQIEQAKATRKTTSTERKEAILGIYSGLTAEHHKRGKMHVYCHIAALSSTPDSRGETPWKCSARTVRSILRNRGNGND